MKVKGTVLTKLYRERGYLISNNTVYIIDINNSKEVLNKN